MHDVQAPSGKHRRTLLILNPNTSVSVTQLLADGAAAAAAAAGIHIATATARFGPRYITGEVGCAIAGHAALDAYAAHAQEYGVPDAVLLACFGDPGLFALRALSSTPVVGLAEAAMHAAARQGPFVIVTGGAAWVPMLQRLAASLPLAAPLLGIQAVPRSGGDMAAQPQQAIEWLADAGHAALQRWPGARTLLLGGAGLAGLARPLRPRLPVPVLDNVALALSEALAQATNKADDRSRPRSLRQAENGPWVGVAEELAQFLAPAQAPQ